MLDEAANLADIRTFVIHGAASGFDKEKGEILFIRMDFERATHKMVRRRYSIGKLKEAADKSTILAGRIANLAERLFAAFVR